ncbi:hypothetical protein GJ697_06225 [Pseudoduganella sp. FT25W]|jgi:hypothetical protein|uniref:DUF3325 family protein n=1 Tax=Duganella alba TaxID=2666081 RepID=A0A6L5QCC2_9BURK|nr:hypothetical protein [Duganella alba]MRX07424.1 hypothetical protein [Duganella alba]MRX19727.1 hypothetical protein [Duganella alba]
MNWICIGVAALAALNLYLASPHQTLWPAALRRQAFLRWLAVPLAVGSVATAVDTYGGWCGVCIALSGFMTMLVALPYLDAWRRKGARHVG